MRCQSPASRDCVNNCPLLLALTLALSAFAGEADNLFKSLVQRVFKGEL
jgi:hypothetical protein